MRKILSNGGKYNRTGKKVGISLRVLEKQAGLCVWDDGELISEDLVDTIFEAFVRADKARKTDGGTGLGLAISKVIMENTAVVLNMRYTLGKIVLW